MFCVFLFYDVRGSLVITAGAAVVATIPSIYIYRRLIMCTGTDLSIEISFNHLEVRRYIHIQPGTLRFINFSFNHTCYGSFEIVIRPDVFPVFDISCDHPKQGDSVMNPLFYPALVQCNEVPNLLICVS